MANSVHGEKSLEARDALWENAANQLCQPDVNFADFSRPDLSLEHVTSSRSNVGIDVGPNQVTPVADNRLATTHGPKHHRSCDKRIKWIITAIVAVVCVGLFIMLSVFLVNINSASKSENTHGACSHRPCLNGATCLDDSNIFHCVCPSGFSGNLCEIDENECASNPCSNQGTCHDGAYGYRCQCRNGYSGQHCEVDVDECHSSPCHSGATCHDGPSRYDCQCAAGFTGLNCQTDVDACSPNPCMHGAECIDRLDGFLCTCQANFTGSICQSVRRAEGTCRPGFIAYREMSRCYKIVDNHTTTRAQAMADCHSSGSQLVSVETKEEMDFIGAHLTWPSRDYITSGMKRGGSGYFTWENGLYLSSNDPRWWEGEPKYTKHCVSLVHYGVYPATFLISRECSARSSYVCEAAMDDTECESHPCHNGATCEDLPGRGITCSCLAGFTGRLCETDTTACASNPCGPGSLCHATFFGFECRSICPSGFVPGMDYTKCYLVEEDLGDQLNWADAHEFCEYKDASLVSLESRNEAEFVSGLFNVEGLLHLTSARMEQDTQYYWSTGNVVPNVLWATGGPPSHYDCGAVAKRTHITQLFGVHCAVESAFVCETIPL